MTVRHELLLVRADRVAPELWRNGGGRTRELLAWPAGPDWRLRVSLADIEADGPFSSFVGVQRWFAVIAGAGVELRFADAMHRLAPDSPALHFDGAAAPYCALLDGATRDLNLMARDGAALLQPALAQTDWCDAFTQRGLFTLLPGELRCERYGRVALAPFTLAWELGPGACSFVPDGHAAATRCGWWLGWSAQGSAAPSAAQS